MTGHAFLAVDLSSEERHNLSIALTEANPGKRLPGRQTSPENWHVTLRFLGECSELEADRIMHQLEESLDVDSGSVWCCGLNAFPRPEKASVLYAEIDDPAEMLTRMAMWCNAAAASVGFDPEDRPYVPHLTLARARPVVDVRHTFPSWDDFRVRIAVSAITLFRTRRANAGVRYDRIDTLRLT